MNKAFIFLLLMIFAIGETHSQVNFQNKLIATNVQFYKVDNIGNVYFADKKNILGKFEPQISRYTKFADLPSGRIKSIDISNPLRVLIFYADFFIVRFLDINLTEITNYKINSIYSEGVIRLVCTSNNNGFWVYDEVNRKLLKIGDNFKTTQQTTDLYLIIGKRISPNFLVEFADEVFLNDPKLGILVFDVFGGYKRIIPIKGLVDFSVEKDRIVYTKNNQIIGQSILKTDTIGTFPAALENPFQDKNYFYWLKGDSLFMSSNQFLLQNH